jgi:endonuclease YncB( thermonuclease family)
MNAATTDRVGTTPAAPQWAILALRERTLRWLAICLLFLAQGVAAGEFMGRVVSVQAGDSLSVLVSDKQINVRLADIDAPEREQPFGTRSRQSLADLCANKGARVREAGKDRYGRTLARVVCATVDVNTEQVRRGMAWVNDRRVSDRSLYDFQDEARESRRGLWADLQPTPPWTWRRINRRDER